MPSWYLTAQASEEDNASMASSKLSFLLYVAPEYGGLKYTGIGLEDERN